MECFELGNLDSRRDWGHARDYVQAMWEMLQLEQVKTIESENNVRVLEIVKIVEKYEIKYVLLVFELGN